MITKIFNFSNEKSLPNIAVGEAHGICPPKTSGGDELKCTGIGLALLAWRDDRSLVRTEAVARWSAGWRCRIAAEPLTPDALRERVSHEPDDADDRHYDETCVTILEDEAPDRCKARPLQNDRNSVREDGKEAVAEESIEDPVNPPRNIVALHLARRVESVQNDRGDRESECGEDQIVRVPSCKIGVRHRHHEADHEVERPHEERSSTFRQLTSEVSELLFHFHFASPFLLLGMCYRATMARFIYCLEHSIFGVGSQAQQKITISGVSRFLTLRIKKFSSPKIKIWFKPMFFSGFFCGFERYGSAAFPNFRGGNSSPPQAAKCVRTNSRILHHVGKVKEFWFASRSLSALSADSATNSYSILGVKTNSRFRILGEENFLILNSTKI